MSHKNLKKLLGKRTPPTLTLKRGKNQSTGLSASAKKAKNK
jgi:hypothetical protein